MTYLKLKFTQGCNLYKHLQQNFEVCCESELAALIQHLLHMHHFKIRMVQKAKCTAVCLLFVAILKSALVSFCTFYWKRNMFVSA